MNKNPAILSNEQANAIEKFIQACELLDGAGLSVFSWNGTLCILRESCIVKSTLAVSNDGGDPDGVEDEWGNTHIKHLE